MFTFKPQWKEELLISCPKRNFRLVLSMGIPTAYLPNKAQWAEKSPEWAHDLYAELRKQLEAWCMVNDTKLVIDDVSIVF